MTSNTSYPQGTAQQMQGRYTKHANLPLTRIHRSPFAKTRLQIQLEDLLINNEHLLYSQWFHESAKVIPNILSRDWHISDGKILNLLTHLFPTHLHPYFWLSQVPSMIDYFLCSGLQSLPKPTQKLIKPNPSGSRLG